MHMMRLHYEYPIFKAHVCYEAIIVSNWQKCDKIMMNDLKERYRERNKNQLARQRVAEQKKKRKSNYAT